MMMMIIIIIRRRRRPVTRNDDDDDDDNNNKFGSWQATREPTSVSMCSNVSCIASRSSSMA
jgi:hypothetical protein